MAHYAMHVVANPIAQVETVKHASIITLLSLLKDSVLFIHVRALHVFRATMHLMDFIKMVEDYYKSLIVFHTMELIVFSAKDIASRTKQYYMDSAILTIVNHLHSSIVQITV
jgi:hypothetical protein